MYEPMAKENELIDTLMRDLHKATGCPYNTELINTPKWYVQKLEHTCTILVAGGNWTKESN